MKGSLVRAEGKSACSFEGSTGPGSIEHNAPEGKVPILVFLWRVAACCSWRFVRSEPLASLSWPGSEVS